MRPSLYVFKTRIYAAIAILLFVYAEWVSRTAIGVGDIILFLKGVF
jgi:hypothetical protein